MESWNYSFDHDLAIFIMIINDLFSEKTGYDCANWFIDYIIDNIYNYQKNINPFNESSWK